MDGIHEAIFIYTVSFQSAPVQVIRYMNKTVKKILSEFAGCR